MCRDKNMLRDFIYNIYESLKKKIVYSDFCQIDDNLDQPLIRFFIFLFYKKIAVDIEL